VFSRTEHVAVKKRKPYGWLTVKFVFLKVRTHTRIVSRILVEYSVLDKGGIRDSTFSKIRTKLLSVENTEKDRRSEIAFDNILSHLIVSLTLRDVSNL